MKIGRNDPCPCGSGLKYKKCCLNKPGNYAPKPLRTVTNQSLQGAPPVLNDMSEQIGYIRNVPQSQPGLKIIINKPSILLLFGAGASLECSQTDENPPRGSELFFRLRNEFDKSWKLVDGEYAEYFKKQFEEGMLTLYENPGPNNINELEVGCQ